MINYNTEKEIALWSLRFVTFLMHLTIIMPLIIYSLSYISGDLQHFNNKGWSGVKATFKQWWLLKDY
jgi:hypothetical protein